MTVDVVELLAQTLGYRFERQDLLQEALTHASIGADASSGEMERLEFLGDAVLGAAISDVLLREKPDADEGRLTRLRARMVNTSALARMAVDVRLPELLVLGKGEEKTGGRAKKSILAGAFEAVLGAIFLDGGFAAVLAVVERLFDLDSVAEPDDGPDSKTELQEVTQRRFRCLPAYDTVSVTGPEHDRDFVVEVSIDGKVVGRGSGHSKRAAAQAAAREALQALDESGERVED